MKKAFVFPGQGAQAKGMGKELFCEFKDYVQIADEVLGYSIEKLCLENEDNMLQQTQYTQPAIYVVSALSYLKEVKESGSYPDYVAGHSVGEYPALFAAGALDFASGLRLVKRRGELMSQAKNGSMAAVLGLSSDQVEDVIKKNNLTNIDIANYNSPEQTVISSTVEEIKNAEPYFMEAGAKRYVVLKVSGAFHSRYMQAAADEFLKVIQETEFQNLKIPVISNVTARPYSNETLKDLLFRQLTSSVKWTESVRYMNGCGVTEYKELGPGRVLTGLIRKINQLTEPLIVLDEKKPEKVEQDTVVLPKEEESNKETFECGKTNILGSEDFKKRYHTHYAYVAGGMRNGISSVKMITKMAKSNLLSFLGSCDMELDTLERSLVELKHTLGNGYPYGVNVTYQPNQIEKETKIFHLIHDYNIHIVELGSYIAVSDSIVQYRVNGLKEKEDGTVEIRNKVLLKVSRPEVVEVFMEPISDKIIQRLLMEGKISDREAKLAARVSLVDDFIITSDCAGQTEGGSIAAFYPVMKEIIDSARKKYPYENEIGVGVGGGIGTPWAAASAFIMGADFIETGSINQCSVESGTSNEVKDILQQLNIQDTEICPYMDMFEMRVKCQVVKKGTFFPVRANKLLDYYKEFKTIHEIDERSKKQLEDKFFKEDLESVCNKIKLEIGKDEWKKAEENPKYMLGLVFKQYLYQGFEQAKKGNLEEKVNFQIFCSSAMGSFNSWVKNTDMEDWRNRHVDEMACKIMDEAQIIIKENSKKYY